MYEEQSTVSYLCSPSSASSYCFKDRTRLQAPLPAHPEPLPPSPSLLSPPPPCRLSLQPSLPFLTPAWGTLHPLFLCLGNVPRAVTGLSAPRHLLRHPSPNPYHALAHSPLKFPSSPYSPEYLLCSLVFVHWLSPSRTRGGT